MGDQYGERQNEAEELSPLSEDEKRPSKGMECVTISTGPLFVFPRSSYATRLLAAWSDRTSRGTAVPSIEDSTYNQIRAHMGRDTQMADLSPSRVDTPGPTAQHLPGSGSERVQTLVTEGVKAGAFRPVRASFVGAAVAQVMGAIQRGGIQAASGLDSAAAYRNPASQLAQMP